MTPRAFTEPGTGEALKLGVHAFMGLGAAACAAYNFAAFVHRRETHNIVNGIVYSALLWLEIEHCKHHTGEPSCGQPSFDSL